MNVEKIYIVAIQEIDSMTYEVGNVTIIGAYTTLKVAMSKITTIVSAPFTYPVVFEVPILKDDEGFDIYDPQVVTHFTDTDKL